MWIQGRRRRNTNPAKFMRALVEAFSAREIARLVGVSDRTVRRWASGEDWCDFEVLPRLIDLLFVDSGSLPIYHPDMAIDGNTRVVGVGEYSVRAARGLATEEDFVCLD